MSGTRFHNVREAKEFLAAQITDESRREGAPLSEIERKMLFFSEVGWTLPDMMQVSDEFDRQYDQTDYEKKVTQLIRHLDKRLRKEKSPEYGDWRSSIKFLKWKDHYINVMIRQAGLRPRGDWLRLWATGLAVVAFVMLIIFVSIKYDLHFGRQHRTNPSAAWNDSHDVLMWIWLIITVSYSLLFLLRWVLGEKRLNDVIRSARRMVFGFTKRVGE